MYKKFILLGTFSFLLAFPVKAEMPSVLSLWHQDNEVKMEMSCGPVYNGSTALENKMSCRSTTLFFSHEAKISFDEAWSESGFEVTYSGDDGENLLKNMAVQVCSESSDLIEVMRYYHGLPKKNNDFELSDEQKREIFEKKSLRGPIEEKDFVEFSLSMINFCENISLSSFKKLAKQQHEVSRRTCNIMTQSLEEEFEKVKDGLWVNRTEPDYTDCKRMRISTLRQGDTGLPWDWQFEFRSMSLDKEATDTFGTKCSVIDEKSTDIYTNRSNPVALGCDYLK